MVKNAWDVGDHNVPRSLKEVQDHSQIFNHDIFGNIFRRKRRLEARIKGVQRCLEYRDSYDLVELEKSLQAEYNLVLAQEEMLWFQKSREKWVKFGDQNTSFFHT